MALRISITPTYVEDPSWVWSDRERRVYYAYRYSYIRHCCRMAAGLTKDSERSAELINTIHDLFIDVTVDQLAPRDVYILVLTSFYEEDELAEEVENAIDKEFLGVSIPSTQLIREINDIIEVDGGLVTDIVINENNEHVIIPFLTSKSVFFYTMSVSTMSLNTLTDLIFTIRSRTDRIRRIYIIGLMDSSLQFIDISLML